MTYPGDPGGPVKGGRESAPCPIADRATRDDVWIPVTARQGWLIITRDRHIQEHRAEIAAVKASGARLVTLAGAEAVDTFQLEALMCNSGDRAPAQPARPVHLHRHTDQTSRTAPMTDLTVDRRLRPLRNMHRLGAIKSRSGRGWSRSRPLLRGTPPGQAVELREDLISTCPTTDGGTLYLHGSAPTVGAGWSRSGRRRDPRELKHRASGTVRPVHLPGADPLLALAPGRVRHRPDGRLFRGYQGGDLSRKPLRPGMAGRPAARLRPAVAAFSPCRATLRPAACLPVHLAQRWGRSNSGRRVRATAPMSCSASTPSASTAATNSTVNGSRMHSATMRTSRERQMQCAKSTDGGGGVSFHLQYTE